MAVGEGNVRIAVVLPRELVDEIERRQRVAREAPRAGAYIRSHLAGWLQIDEQMERRTQAEDRRHEEVMSAIEQLRDDLQGTGLISGREV